MFKNGMLLFALNLSIFMNHSFIKYIYTRKLSTTIINRSKYNKNLKSTKASTNTKTNNIKTTLFSNTNKE